MVTTVMEMSHTAFAGVRAQRRRCNQTVTLQREAEPNSLVPDHGRPEVFEPKVISNGF
jgi:hypothetical protein